MDYFSHGGDVYTYENVLDFSANINPLGMPQPVREALLAHIGDVVLYPDFLCRQLSEALVSHEEYAGFLNEEEVVWGNGASELIFALVHALKPRRALVLAPAFSEYERALEAVHAETAYHFLDRKAGFAPGKAILEQLEAMEKPDMLWLSNPSNPVGSLMDGALAKEIAEYCKKRNIYLVMDECFMDFVSNKEDYSLRAEIGENPYLFVLNAFTKSYALPGLRIGFGISSNGELLRAMREQLPFWNVSVMAQRAGIALLHSNLKEYGERTREHLAAERIRLTEALAACGCKTFPGAANFIFFHDTGYETDGRELGKQLLREKILIRSCGNYRGLTGGDYRIAIRSREENDVLLAALQSL